MASRGCHIQAMQQLVELGADLGSLNAYEETALHESGGAEAVRVLVALGLEVDATNRYGATPLHNAAAEGTLTVARALVEMGANLAAENGYGMTPSQLAAMRGHGEVLGFLEHCAALGGHHVRGTHLFPKHRLRGRGVRGFGGRSQGGDAAQLEGADGGGQGDTEARDVSRRQARHSGGGGDVSYVPQGVRWSRGRKTGKRCSSSWGLLGWLGLWKDPPVEEADPAVGAKGLPGGGRAAERVLVWREELQLASAVKEAADGGGGREEKPPPGEFDL